MAKGSPPLGSPEWRKQFDRDFERTRRTANRVAWIAFPLAVISALVVLAGVCVGIYLLLKNFG